MGFAKDVLKAGLSPVAAIIDHKKKPPVATQMMQPSMISTSTKERPISMIGSRGGY